VYETKALPAAPFIAFGVAFSVVGWPTLAAAAYYGLVANSQVNSGGDAGSSVPVALIGWSLVLAGAALLAIGVYRLVQHVDRRAGVRFTRDARAQTRWTTTQPDDVLLPDLSRTESRTE
jgi:hypothetical protein